MSEVTFSPEDQREMLLRYLNQPEVLHRENPLMRHFDMLISDCLVANELSVGVSLIALVAARGAGMDAQAAEALLELIASRPGRIRTCRACGCTDSDCSRCVERTGGPCHWVEADLCSACAPAGEGGGA